MADETIGELYDRALPNRWVNFPEYGIRVKRWQDDLRDAAAMNEPVGERCLCSHLIETHDLGIRGGQKVRTKCSNWGCGCREYRREEVSDERGEGTAAAR